MWIPADYPMILIPSFFEPSCLLINYIKILKILLIKYAPSVPFIMFVETFIAFNIPRVYIYSYIYRSNYRIIHTVTFCLVINEFCNLACSRFKEVSTETIASSIISSNNWMMQIISDSSPKAFPVSFSKPTFVEIVSFKTVHHSFPVRYLISIFHLSPMVGYFQ